MVTSLIKNGKYTSHSCTSLTSFSHRSSFSKLSTRSLRGIKRQKKEVIHSVCLKPKKGYPLPLPKSVPHLPKVFFTEHLLVNCIFCDESETNSVQTTEVDKKQNQEYTIEKENTTVHEPPIFRSVKLPLSRPKIPAPDFKLRESRRLLTNRLVENVLVCQQRSKPRIESINILINCRSNENIFKNQNIKIKSNRNKLNNFNSNKIQINDSNNSSYKNSYCNIDYNINSNETHEDFLVAKPNQKGSTFIERKNILLNNIKPSFYNKSENFLKNNVEVCCQEKSQFVFKKPRDNHLSFCEVNSVYCCNNIFKKNREDQQRRASEESQSKFLALSSNKVTSSCSSATKIFQKVGITLTFTKKVLNEQLFNVYSCIANKIEGYILHFQPKNITESCNCVTRSSKNMFQTLRKKPNLQVGFTAHSYNTDVNVLQATSNNFNEMSEGNYSGNTQYAQKNPSVDKKGIHGSGYGDGINPSASSKSENKVDQTSCICNCSCKGKAGRCRWKLFHHSNISESLFFGPTLDEAIFNIICYTRQILEKVGLISSSEKESKDSNSSGDDKLHAGSLDDCSDNSLDVVKWLHDEYLNLAKDVAEANNASEHNCPCTKDNCPVILQSRRFVLDRLAELLEKKQEIENAYRKKEKHKNV